MRFLGFGGGNVTALEADLRKITEAELIDVPNKDIMRSIMTASHDANDRREIMRHLHDCLSEKSVSQKWRRIHGGLVLMEQLLQRGSPVLVRETAEGHHFDLVQRLTFLEHFVFESDTRVQQMVRQKASVLRAEMIQRLQGADVGGLDSVESGDTSNFAASTSTTSAPSRPAQPTKAKHVYVNGIVLVGHRDDTDSESDDDRETKKQMENEERRKQEKRRQRHDPKNLEERRRHVLQDSTDSESDKELDRRKAASKPYAGTAPPAAPAPVQEVNLLDM